DLLSSENIALNVSEYNQIVTEVLDEVLGLGPLEPFLKDPTVSDILVNTYRQVYVERAGRLEPTPAHFKDERHLMRIIQKIVGAVGRRVDESQPWVDAQILQDAAHGRQARRARHDRSPHCTGTRDRRALAAECADLGRYRFGQD